MKAYLANHNLANVEETSPGVPMTVQQAYTEVIGSADMSLERYEVYAYLKCLDVVLRCAEPLVSDFLLCHHILHVFLPHGLRQYGKGSPHHSHPLF